ncbi:hypothetical protein [Janthinobacterium fluminis]|uniref:Uncharacterized protein n=1 Tax=Janthinobacterium fluminis TaxID=2987524 RepID=A0ABT5JVZ8_9BURK|nr:hypothetical protein [Janthinobacterium fluminis]MDC8756908.1 hypothetical protein [Janthinobacterium fluminis]
MVLPDFEIHLGGGVYIDSAGNLRVGAQPPSTVPVYSPPFELPIDPGKLKDSVSSIEKALKGFTTDPDVRAKFERFGYADKILDVLCGVAAIASVIAPVVSVLAFAASVLKMLGFFKAGPSPFEASVEQSLATLKSGNRFIFSEVSELDITKAKSRLHSAWTSVDGYYGPLRNGNLSLEQAQQMFQDMKDIVLNILGDVEFLCSQNVWKTMFDRESYGLWAYHQVQMKTMPRSDHSDFVQAYFPPDETPAFDHRMMLPIVLFAANTYLACLRGTHPEFRTIGNYRTKLIALADQIDELAESMRNFGLGRLIYRPEDFQTISAGDVNYVKLFDQWIPLGIKPSCAAWPIGALDLRYHDNAFFYAFLSELSVAEVRGWPHETKKAGVEFRWIPPAQLAPAQEFDGQPGLPPSTFTILNPADCAAAANAQSEKDYADLLVTSGYLQLLRIAALVRNEATEPLVSQTVSLRRLSTYRDPQASEEIEVSSGGSGWVQVTKSPARHEPQRFAARAQVSTQPLKRPFPVQYEIYLRTLNQGGGEETSSDLGYSDYCRPYYVPEKRPSGSGGEWTDNVLEIQTVDGVMLDEHLIAHGSSSFNHDDVRQEIELRVDSFDWWIPVASRLGLLDHPANLAGALSEVNWFPTVGGGAGSTNGGTSGPGSSGDRTSAPTGIPATQMDMTGLVVEQGLNFGSFAFVGWKSGNKTWDGERRDPKRLTAKIKYELTWQGDALHVQIETRPEDRNFTLFLVIEELLPSTGKKLHTAIPIPVNGSLTYVPEDFFRREAEAVAQGAQAIARFYKRRLVEEQDIGPFPDPAFRTITPSDLLSRQKVTNISQHLQDIGVNLDELQG